MMCKWLEGGCCRAAERIAGCAVQVGADACKVCQQTATPKTGEPNRVTVAIAVRATHGERRRAIIERYGDLIRREGYRPTFVPECVYRGVQTGERECKLCGRHGQPEPVYACQIHGSCTVRKYRNGSQPEAVCLVCPERSSS